MNQLLKFSSVKNAGFPNIQVFVSTWLKVNPLPPAATRSVWCEVDSSLLSFSPPRTKCPSVTPVLYRLPSALMKKVREYKPSWCLCFVFERFQNHLFCVLRTNKIPLMEKKGLELCCVTSSEWKHLTQPGNNVLLSKPTILWFILTFLDFKTIKDWSLLYQQTSIVCHYIKVTCAVTWDLLIITFVMLVSHTACRWRTEPQAVVNEETLWLKSREWSCEGGRNTSSHTSFMKEGLQDDDAQKPADGVVIQVILRVLILCWVCM